MIHLSLTCVNKKSQNLGEIDWVGFDSVRIMGNKVINCG
jgi:hypothetical protein